MAIVNANTELLPNGLGDIAPNLYTSVETVARELTGLVSAVTINTGDKVAALGSQITSFRTRARSARNTKSGHTPDTVPAHGMDTPNLQITKARTVPIRYTDDEMANFEQGDAYGFQKVLSHDMEQAMRTLVNEVEADLGALFKVNRQWDVGTAGTAPFASSAAPTQDTAKLRRVLNLSGAPRSNRCLVLTHAAAEALLSNPSLAKVNESGNGEVLRDGAIARVGGFDIFESHYLDVEDNRVAASAPAAAQKINLAAGYKKGSTGPFVCDAGTSSTAPTGSTIYIGTTPYVVETYSVASAVATFTIRGGLLEDVANDTDVDPVASHEQSIALYKGAAELAIRAPARPRRDNARDVMIVRDPQSMLAFEIAEYAEHRQHYWEVSAVWGQQVWQREYVAGLLG